MTPDPNDTICALATPAGRGGIGVIRISGRNAFAIVDAISVRKNDRNCASYRSHTLHRATVTDNDGQAIDDVVLAIFRGPNSYTGEDVVEISAHGGPVPLRRILSLLYTSGARPAAPGEFTQRAFLNGKMDLAQAEAVADMIEAETDEAHRLAVSQQAGRLSAEVTAIRDIVLGVMARIEASIDFPEDVGDLDTAACRAEIETAASRLDALLATADTGILYREGIKVVLVGRPNVGKSSLMNALLKTDRAIVTPIPGTTRDVIEESANIQGIKVRFVDTAGMRETSDVIEQMGVERSRASAKSADLVLLVVDASVGETSEDAGLRESLGTLPYIEVRNKWDIVTQSSGVGVDSSPLSKGPGSGSDSLPFREGLGVGICVSAATGWNLDALERAIVERVTSGSVAPLENAAAVVTHSRHRHALAEVRERLSDSLRTLADSLPADFVSIDVRGALVALGEISGETATDDIINEIFSRFCIGK